MFRTALSGIVALGMISLAGLDTAQAQRFDTIEKSGDITLNTYGQVYIAPVKVALEPEKVRRRGISRNPNRNADPNSILSDEDLEFNAGRLHHDLVNAFGKNFTLVEEPGEGVLTVDTTITRLVSTRPTAKELGRTGGLDPLSIGAGGASYLVELKEGETPLVTIAERDQSTLNDGVPRFGIWQDAERSFNRFSRNLARYTKRN
ncbi:MAG: DUF3313 family protein [Pseudomonadota bacterium]